eukprot:229899_1
MALSVLERIDNILTAIDTFSCNDTLISKQEFGQNKNKTGPKSYLYTLKNNQGMEVEVMNYGGRLRSIKVPDKNGQKIDVVIGLDTLEDYFEKDLYFGCIVGRYANRMCKGTFTLNNTEYKLAINSAPSHLHGGVKGFDKQFWDIKEIETKNNGKYSCGVELKYLSPDLDENYPAICDVTVQYLMHKYNNILEIKYLAKTDSQTIVNLTNHAYWNLDGTFNENGIYKHKLKINSQYITSIDGQRIPNGELRNVINTPFDFNNFHEIGERVDDQKDEQILNGGGKSGGYNHNYVLKNKHDDTIITAAEVYSNESGIKLIIKTDQVGLQFYGGHLLNGCCGKGNKYEKSSAFCLETQHFPDSCNHTTFPTTVLTKDKPFESITIYAFDTI